MSIFGVDLAETIYAPDATTIDLCLTVFPWAPFRSTKAAIKLSDAERYCVPDRAMGPLRGA